MNVLVYNADTPTNTPATITLDNKEPSFVSTDDNRNTFVASFNGMISTLNTDTNVATHFSFNGSGDAVGGESNGEYFNKFWSLESDTVNLWISTKGTAFNRLNLSTQEIIGTEVGDPVVIPDLITTLSSAFNDMVVPVASPISMLIENEDGTFTSQGTSVKDNMDENYTLNPIISSGAYQKILCIPEMKKQIWNGTSFTTRTYPKQIAVSSSAGMHIFPNDKFWRDNSVEVNALAMISSGDFDYTGD
jgi:hypothetical protein